MSLNFGHRGPPFRKALEGCEDDALQGHFELALAGKCVCANPHGRAALKHFQRMYKSTD